MRVAVIGANFLGSSAAFYTRRALESNENDPEKDTPDEIVVFEKLNRTGGHKFVTVKLNQAQVAVGTATDVDIAASPPMRQLFLDAKLPLPQNRRNKEWAIFDWDEDQYKLGRVRSSTLTWIRSSYIALALLQFIALSGLIYFGQLFVEQGFSSTFFRPHRGVLDRGAIFYGRCVQFATVCMLGGGIIPMGWLVRMYNWIWFCSVVGITSRLTYGTNVSGLGYIIDGFKEHLKVVIERDAASSCVTLSHLLSACGMAKYGKVNGDQLLRRWSIEGAVIEDVVAPGLHITYGDRASTVEDVNGLAMLCNMLGRCPVPLALRSNARYLDAEQTASLCDTLLERAGADVHLGVEVEGIMSHGDGKYEITVRGNKDNWGVFDAVVIAATFTPSELKSDVINVNEGFGEWNEVDEFKVNTAKYVGVVQGKLKGEWFKKSDEKGVADYVQVVKSVNCSEVKRVGDGKWRVLTSESVQKGSSALDILFTKVNAVNCVERRRGRFGPRLVKGVADKGIPDLVLGTRLLNAACIDRVGSDVTLDVLAARNAASLLKNSVATWK